MLWNEKALQFSLPWNILSNPFQRLPWLPYFNRPLFDHIDQWRRTMRQERLLNLLAETALKRTSRLPTSSWDSRASYNFKSFTKSLNYCPFSQSDWKFVIFVNLSITALHSILNIKLLSAVLVYVFLNVRLLCIGCTSVLPRHNCFRYRKTCTISLMFATYSDAHCETFFVFFPQGDNRRKQMIHNVCITMQDLLKENISVTNLLNFRFKKFHAVVEATEHVILNIPLRKHLKATWELEMKTRNR